MFSRKSFSKELFISLLFSFIGSLVLTNAIFAQQGEKDYVRIDSVYSHGKVVPLGKDKVRFLGLKKEPVTYTAREAQEYGRNGKTYESLVVRSAEPAFYRKVAGDKTALFKDKRHFLLRHQGELIPLNKQNYRSILSKLPALQDKDHSLAKLTFSEPSLRTFIGDCTIGLCQTDFFPHRKIGLLAGYQTLRISTSFESGIHLQENAATFSMGVFADFPLYRPRWLFITTELHAFNIKTSLYQESAQTTHLLGLDAAGLRIPLGVKLLLTNYRPNFYLKVAGLISYVNLTSSTHYFTTEIHGADVEISRPALQKSQELLWGTQFGLGSEIPVKNRKNFHLELKWTLPARGDFDSFSMNISGISIYAGINF